MRSCGWVLTAALAVSGCGPAARDDARDAAVDPVAKAAVADPLMTDPDLKRRSNTDSLRPPDEPFQALVPPGEPTPFRPGQPPTLAGRMASYLGTSPFAACERRVSYSFGWAARLPDGLELDPEARVVEAAGSESASCALRMAAFSTTAAPAATAEAWRRAATAKGYAISEGAAGGGTALTARAARGGGLVVVIYPDGGSGSTVDVMTAQAR